MPAVVFVAGSQLGAAMLLLPLMPVFPPAQSAGWLEIGAVICLAVLSTSLAFLIYFQLLREVGPTRTLTVTYLIPVFAIAWGALLLGETVTPQMLLGGGLILAGVALANSALVSFRTAVPRRATQAATVADEPGSLASERVRYRRPD